MLVNVSEAGYGAVTYLSLQNVKNDIHVVSLIGKARVTPLKMVTMAGVDCCPGVEAPAAGVSLLDRYHLC